MFSTNIISALVVCILFYFVLPHVEADFKYYGPIGPEHWGEEYTKCYGKHQSPININLLDVVNIYAEPLVITDFLTSPKSAEILNNGHTVIVHLNYANAIPTVSGGPFKPNSSYQFAQYHFHWGENNTIGSEDQIDNVPFAAELHMVFFNSKYDTFNEAITEPDGVAVLASFLKVVEREVPEYEQITALFDNIIEPDLSVTLLNPPALTEVMSNDIYDYFTYIGSLTTPPCSEDVIWIDFIEPSLISSKQINRFRRVKTQEGKSMSNNFRPIQPLNNRRVFRVQQELETFILPYPSSIPFYEARANGISSPRPSLEALWYMAVSLYVLSMLFEY